MSAIKTLLYTKKVHTAAFTFRATCCLTVKLSHTLVCSHSFSKSPPVVAISCDKRIFLLSCGHTTCSKCLLTYISVKKSTNFSGHFIHLFSLQFKLANKLH